MENNALSSRIISVQKNEKGKLFKSGVRIGLVFFVAGPVEFSDGQKAKKDECGNYQQCEQENISVIHVIVAFSGLYKPATPASLGATGQ